MLIGVVVVVVVVVMVMDDEVRLRLMRLRHMGERMTTREVLYCIVM